MDLNLQNGIDFQTIEEIEDTNMNTDYTTIPVSMQSISTAAQINMSAPKKKAKRFRDEESRKKWEDMMTIKRRKLYISIVKKETGKQHRAKMNRHKEMLLQCKRVATHCVKAARQKAVSNRLINNLHIY